MMDSGNHHIHISCNKSVNHIKPCHLRRRCKEGVQPAGGGENGYHLIKEDEAHHAGPEKGNGHAHHGNHPADVVHPAVPVHRREDPQKDTKDHCNHHGRQGQLQGGGKIAGQFAGHGHLGADGNAHVPMGQSLHVHGVLGEHRFIQPQGLARRLQRLRRCVGPHQHAGRIPGDDVGYAEGNNGYADKHKDEMYQFLKYKSP